MHKFTFVVCQSCGCQSPPILLEDKLQVAIPLAAMGWRFDKFRFNAVATCPQCLSFKKDGKAETAKWSA